MSGYAGTAKNPSTTHPELLTMDGIWGGVKERFVTQKKI